MKRIAFFLVLIVVVMAFNSWYLNGPLLDNNLAISREQLSGKTSAVAGDIKIAGYYLSFNVIFALEAIVLALVGMSLFLQAWRSNAAQNRRGS